MSFQHIMRSCKEQIEKTLINALAETKSTENQIHPVGIQNF